ncbi:MAG: hypothetical protein KAI17_08445, partial [Thiotrichaceae bacterium]|nr:hypothetical protein [Thiotrichaceae bacterium]
VIEYDLKDEDKVCKASFIDDPATWKELEKVEKDGFLKPGKHWELFIKASIDRTVDIYEEWYECLSIKELMK